MSKSDSEPDLRPDEFNRFDVTLGSVIVKSAGAAELKIHMRRHPNDGPNVSAKVRTIHPDHLRKLADALVAGAAELEAVQGDDHWVQGDE